MSGTEPAAEPERPADLDAIRARLTEVADLPVDERPARFAEVNEALVAELAAMEEV